MEYLAAHNEAPKPFVWTAGADLILERAKKVCERISNSGHYGSFWRLQIICNRSHVRVWSEARSPCITPGSGRFTGPSNCSRANDYVHAFPHVRAPTHGSHSRLLEILIHPHRPGPSLRKRGIVSVPRTPFGQAGRTHLAPLELEDGTTFDNSVRIERPRPGCRATARDMTSLLIAGCFRGNWRRNPSTSSSATSPQEVS